jgi:hypothetical protein
MGPGKPRLTLVTGRGPTVNPAGNANGTAVLDFFGCPACLMVPAESESESKSDYIRGGHPGPLDTAMNGFNEPSGL